MSVVRQRFSPGNDSAVGARSSVSTEERTPTRHHARKEHGPLLACGYERSGVDQDESRDGWSRGALILPGVGHAAHDAAHENDVPLLHCNHLSAVELDIDLA